MRKLATVAQTDPAAPTIPLESKNITNTQGHTPSRMLIIVITAVVLFFSCAGWPHQSGSQVALVAGDLGFLLAMRIVLWRR